jgi:hypothetical protein
VCCPPPEFPIICTVKVPRGVLPLVESVRVAVVPLLPGIALDGEKLHVAALGSPEQESATAELNAPPTGLMVILNLADWPCFTVATLGVAAMEKSPPTPLRLTLGVLVVMPSEPVTANVPKRVPVPVGMNVMLKAQEAPPRTPAAEQLFA